MTPSERTKQWRKDNPEKQKILNRNSNKRWKKNHPHYLPPGFSLAKNQENNRRIYLRDIEYIRKLKTKPCVDCGKTFNPVCMDFDHIKGDKLFNVSALASRKASISRIDKEIIKCELVCANCHRIRTSKIAINSGQVIKINHRYLK